MLELATQHVVYLAPSTDRDTAPQWSPDSGQIVFIRQPGREYKRPIIPVHAEPWSLWIGNAQTGEGRELFHSGVAM